MLRFAEHFRKLNSDAKSTSHQKTINDEYLRETTSRTPVDDRTIGSKSFVVSGHKLFLVRNDKQAVMRPIGFGQQIIASYDSP